MAQLEQPQHDKQIEAAEARLEVSRKSLERHDLQASNTRDIEQVMRSKFSNQELYSWMVSQLATLHSQSYQLAFDVARRVEACYRYELARDDATFIQYDYWDSLKKGLLAGEKLQVALEVMEASYHEKDLREYELTKPVSLEQLDPVALVRLKEEGVCFFELPEALFDLDFPGHYLRRIKGLTLSIPCVSGPFSTVNAKLTLVSSKVRASSTLSGTYTDSANFAEQTGSTESIVTSTGQEDSGLFQFNFADARYLPFEGRGAVSVWKLELTSPYPAFDPRSISDVAVTLRYTARDGGSVLAGDAVGAIEAALNAATTSVTEASYTDNTKGQVLGLSAARDFPDAWHAFLSSVTVDTTDPLNHKTTHSLTLPITAALFSEAHRQAGIANVTKVTMMLITGGSYGSTLSSSSASFDGSVTFTGFSTWQVPQVLQAATGALTAQMDSDFVFNYHEDDWGTMPTVQVNSEDQLDPEGIQDVLVFFHYTLS